MPCRLLALALDADDPDRLAAFWAGVLGRPVVDGARGVLLPGAGAQVALRFVPGRTPRSGPDRVHLRLTGTGPADRQRTVATALELGATSLDVGRLPHEEHVVLADPEGNEFRVVGPGDAFPAGCGLLGELACDGTRGAGSFWAGVLGWPLVGDRGEEAAVQHPSGGTRIAWSGLPPVPKHGRNRQRFELAAGSGDQGAEVGRLVSLGATILGGAGEGTVELADPDGNEFHLSAG